MSKRLKRQQKPRYITIRIQYYPIPKEIFFVLFFFVCISFVCISFCVQIVSNIPKNNVVILEPFGFPQDKLRNNEAIESFNQILSKSLLLQDDKKNNHLKNVLPNDQVIFHGTRDEKVVALTFDADMTPGMKLQLETGEVASYYNKQVIDVLNQTQTKATLFLTGMWIELYPEATREFGANPLFELASHSYSHPSFAGTCYGLGEIADSDDTFQLQKTQALLKAVAGVQNTLFRFPGGCYDKHDVLAVQQNGMQVIQWDAAGQDGFNEDVAAIEQNVINNAQNGSIIVLHMHGGPNAPRTADALPTIIANLKEQGYTFVKVSELLGPSNLLSLPQKWYN